MKNRILVTGAQGYVGKVAMRYFYEDLKNGRIDRLVAMDIRDLPESEQLEAVDYETMDIRDEAFWKVLEKHEITAVVHLVAIVDSHSCPRQMQYEIDVLGTKNVLDACLRTGTKRVVVTSSGAAYGYYKDNPEWLRESDELRGNKIFAYSDHKRLVEEMMADYRDKHPELEQVIFRVGTIMGASTDNLITNLFQKSNVLGLRGYKSPYVFIWDEDVAMALQQAVFSDKPGIYNLAGNGAIKNSDLAKILGKRYLNLPVGLIRAVLWLTHSLKLGKYGPEQIMFVQYRPVLDNKKLKETFGFQPRKSSLEAFQYYLENNGQKAQNLDKIEIMYPD